MYIIIKHIHLLLVAITLVLFNLRFWLKVVYPDHQTHRVLKILPHLNDTLLLLTGLWTMHLAKWNPVGNAQWLGIKLLLLVVYILAGSWAIKSTPRSQRAWIGYGVAMFCIISIMYLARFKPF